MLGTPWFGARLLLQRRQRCLHGRERALQHSADVGGRPSRAAIVAVLARIPHPVRHDRHGGGEVGARTLQLLRQRGRGRLAGALVAAQRFLRREQRCRPAPQGRV